MHREIKKISFIDCLIFALFVTNFWIILYTKSIDYLYYAFPPSVGEYFYSTIRANPEPFEILLYLVYSMLFVALIWFYQIYIKDFLKDFKQILERSQIYQTVKYAILIFLLLLFLGKLGSFPLKGDIYPFRPNLDHQLILTVFFLYLSFILFLTFQFSVLDKFFTRLKLFPHIFYILIGLFLLIFIFDKNSPLSLVDTSFFYGPAFEISSGKTILSQVPSQYGFLSIFLFALIYKITQINFLYLPILILLMYVMEYLLILYLILKVSKSVPFSLLGFFSLITVNYFSGNYGIQAGPLRWFPLFFLIFLFCKFKKIDSRGIIFTIPFLAFWAIDAGVALMAGYLLTLFILFLAKKIDLPRLLSSLFYLAISIIIFVALIQIGHLILGLQSVDFFELYQSIKKNAVLAMLMVPIGDHSYFWLFMLAYFSSVIYFLSNLKARIPELSILILSANLMFFASIYYVGRSMPHELFTITPFLILTFFLLSGLLYRNLSAPTVKLTALVFLFLISILFPAWHRKEYIASKIINKYQNRIISESLIPGFQIEEAVKKTYLKEAEFINRNIKNDGAVILSPDDTYLFYLTKKKNLLNANPAVGAILLKSDMSPVLKNLSGSCPEKIVVDCSHFDKCPDYKTFITREPVLIQSVLNEIEKKCAFIYRPTLCSQKFCIAEKNLK